MEGEPDQIYIQYIKSITDKHPDETANHTIREDAAETKGVEKPFKRRVSIHRSAEKPPPSRKASDSSRYCKGSVKVLR
jgi:hypothetical protein